MRKLESLANPVGHGCYVDGHWGWRGILRLLEQFDGVAFELDDADRAVIRAYSMGWERATEYVVGLADDAESALNDLLPEGTVAHWHDGEFFVSPQCEDGDCDDETCAHWC